MLTELHTRLRAEAAVQLAEGQLEEAHALAMEGLAAVPRSFDQGFAKAEADWLRDIIARVEQQVGTVEPGV